MSTDGQVLERIITEVQQLSLEDRLRLIQRVAETLAPIKATPPRFLVYGQFSGKRMSTEEDFLIAEWRPTERDLHGP